MSTTEHEYPTNPTVAVVIRTDANDLRATVNPGSDRGPFAVIELGPNLTLIIRDQAGLEALHDLIDEASALLAKAHKPAAA